jgi:integrase
VKAAKVQRSWVEPEQLMGLIEAADEYHRPILATLAGAGLRVGEALALDWRKVNLATGTLRVGEAKTDAGSGREVDLPGGLIDALAEWKTRTPRAEPTDPIFVSRTGRRQTVTNVDHRFKGAIKAANERRTKQGIEPISERVSPHSLRRTYASLRAARRDARSTSRSSSGIRIRRSRFASIRRPRASGEARWRVPGRVRPGSPMGRNRQNRRGGGIRVGAGIRTLGRNLA